MSRVPLLEIAAWLGPFATGGHPGWEGLTDTWQIILARLSAAESRLYPSRWRIPTLWRETASLVGAIEGLASGKESLHSKPFKILYDR
jgi:hypothetical protein